MIEDTTIFLATASLLGLLAVVFFTWTRTKPSAYRHFGYAVTTACVAMSGAYFFMAAEILTVATTGGDQSLARFIGYTIAQGAVAYLLWQAAEIRIRYILLLLGGILLSFWATVPTWIFGGSISTAFTLLIVLSTIVVVALFLGPLAKDAKQASGEQTLLFGKLRNLSILVLCGLILTGFISAQNLALTDDFVGQTVATYLDLIWLAGIGTIILRSDTALQNSTRSTTSTTVQGDTGPETTAD